jgi:glycosyltransferase involved in cell wall biosynthesis
VKLAIIGSRGAPACYGGFETLAEELGSRLAARGHEVWVYGRSNFIDRELTTYRGMRLVVLPAPRRKHLETVVHTLLAAVHAAREGYDAVLLLNAANAPWTRILQLAGIPVALNVDGLERKRRKWGWAGRSYYRICERLAALMPDALVTDAEVIRRYYRRSYGAPSSMIAYGGDLTPPEGTASLDELGLQPGEYLLYVSRFEPENNPDRVARAYTRVPGVRPLVMVGGAPYAPELARRLAATDDPRILFPGPLYGEHYRQLLFNCRAYIHATEVGGTHPALVEAMGAGRAVLYYDTPENREVVRGAGRPFRFQGAGSLERVLSELITDRNCLDELGARARQRVAERYRWDEVARRYECLLESLC